METRDRPPPHMPKLWEHHGLLWEARRAWESSTAIASQGVAGASGPHRGAGASPEVRWPRACPGRPPHATRRAPAGTAVRPVRQGMGEECQKLLFTEKVATVLILG